MRIEAIVRLPGQTADAWDTQRREAEEIVSGTFNGWIAKNPTMTRVVLATVAHTAIVAPMRLAQGFVDVLRLGQGIKEGGALGYLEDGFRVLAIAGPTMRVLGKASGGLKWLITAPGGGRCTWISAAMALRMSGVRHYATVKDLARAAGLSIRETGPSYVTYMAKLLEKLGAQTKRVNPSLGGANAEENLAIALRETPNSVALFSYVWRERGKHAAHAMVARLNASGALEILDRPGSLGSIGGQTIRVAKSLSAVSEDMATGLLRSVLIVKGGVAVTQQVPRLAVTAAASGPYAGLCGMIGLETKAIVVESGLSGR